MSLLFCIVSVYAITIYCKCVRANKILSIVYCLLLIQTEEEENYSADRIANFLSLSHKPLGIEFENVNGFSFQLFHRRKVYQQGK